MFPDPSSGGTSPGELTTVFAQLHGMLLSQDDADAAVRQLARVAQQMIPGATGAGVSLLDEDGSRTSTASTDPAVEAADALQYELGTGPCLSAWATGQTQWVEDTAVDPRWASWSSAAAEAGIRSVLSAPLIHRGRALGALKIYATTPSAFGDAEQQRLGLLADAAATLLSSAQPVEAPVRLSESLRAALASRETVALATGVLMAREHLAPEAARSVLLERARAQGRHLAQVAVDVLEAA
ncbi:GAF and ANTAR domain-containing protein [Kocuria aegyptia]|uniref:GAF and ANTAR domain-containing protein n=1 Tax=Kocuria aegyptia TaxID=330943 RepID=A0ABP4WUT7_9MICC